MYEEVVKVNHDDSHTVDKLNLIVDQGDIMKKVFVFKSKRNIKNRLVES